MAASFINRNQRKTNKFIRLVFAPWFALVFGLLMNGVSEDDPTRISLVEGDSVILHTGVEINQQNRLKWYFTDSLIAQISVNTNKTSNDVQYDNGTESFKGRLKLDNQTGSLTIMNMTTADSGDYQLKIFSSRRPREMVFKVTVGNNGAFAAEQDNVKRLSVKEGEYFTLNTFLETKSYDLKLYFNDTLITGNDSEDQRFTDRLKLNHQTGSLTIMNSRISDSGEYLLEINSYRSINFTILKTFSVNVTAVPDSSKNLKVTLSVIGVLMFFAGAFGVMYYCHRSSRNGKYHLSTLLGKLRFYLCDLLYKADKKQSKEEDLDKVIEEDGETLKSDDRRGSEPDSLKSLLTK